MSRRDFTMDNNTTTSVMPTSPQHETLTRTTSQQQLNGVDQMRLPYLDELENERNTELKSPDPSKFWHAVREYVLETDKEIGDKEPTFLEFKKQLWRQKRMEIQKIQEELNEVVLSDSKDESRLLETCQRISYQKDGDKKLRNIVERVHKGELSMNRVYSWGKLLRENEKERNAMREENERLKLEIKELQEAAQKQAEVANKKKQEMLDLQTQFGGVIVREIANKEREIREEFTEKEKLLKAQYDVKVQQEVAKKQEEIAKLQDEIDALKMKNVEWVMGQAQMMEKLDKAERELEKTVKMHRNLQQLYVRTQNDLSQLQFEYTQVRKEYSELFISHKNLHAQYSIKKDLSTMEDLESKWNSHVNNKKKDKFATVTSANSKHLS